MIPTEEEYEKLTGRSDGYAHVDQDTGEVVIAAVDNVMYQIMTEEQKKIADQEANASLCSRFPICGSHAPQHHRR